MAKNQGSNGNKRQFDYDDPVVIISIVAVFAFLAWAIWHFGHTQISTFYVYLRYAQIYPFYVIGTEIQVWPMTWAAKWVAAFCAPSSVGGLCSADFSKMQWWQLKQSAFPFNVFTFLLIFVTSIWLFLKINKTHPKAKYVKTHNIKSFINENKALYPHLRLFAGLDLINKSLTDPIYGMSKTSRQFAYKNLLISGFQEEEDGWLPIIDRAKVTEIFTAQLGKLWQQIDTLSSAETLLLAIALPRVAATDNRISDDTFKTVMKDSENMIAWCWSHFEAPEKITSDDWLRPTIDLAYPREIIRKYIDADPVKVIFSRHAYVRTILWEVYTQARRLGVLPPAEMRWLRFYDRECWYVLQNIMRLAGYAEGIAPLSHYYYETKSKMPLIQPQVDKAVSGFETALQAFRYNDEKKKTYEGLVEKARVKTEKVVIELSRPDPQAALQRDVLLNQLKAIKSEPRYQAGKQALAWLADDALIMDFETTGLGEDAQAIEMCVVNNKGETVFSRRIRPTVAIHPAAQQVHGISMAMLEQEQQWKDISEEVERLLSNRYLITYNADYDMGILRQTQKAFGLSLSWIDTIKPLCAMKLAQSAYQSPKFLKLRLVIDKERLTWRGDAHTASADTLAVFDWLSCVAAAARAHDDEYAALLAERE